MVNQFITLERGEQGDVELVGEGRFGQGDLQSVDVGPRKVFARQCDVHVGMRKLQNRCIHRMSFFSMSYDILIFGKITVFVS